MKYKLTIIANLRAHKNSTRQQKQFTFIIALNQRIKNFAGNKRQ